MVQSFGRSLQILRASRSPAALCTRGDLVGGKPSQVIMCPPSCTWKRLTPCLQAGCLGGCVPAACPARVYHGAGAAAGATAPALAQGGPSEQSTRPPLGRLMHDAHARVTAAPPLLASTSLRVGRSGARLVHVGFMLPAPGAHLRLTLARLYLPDTITGSLHRARARATRDDQGTGRQGAEEGRTS
jgi:hypothetical protein